MDCTNINKNQSQTRPRFDAFHQMDDMRITSYSLRYQLNPPNALCPTTFPVDPTTRLQFSGDSWKQGKWKTDVESDLFGVNRLSSRVRADEILYNPTTNQFNNTPTEHATDEATNPMTFNRLFNPPCTLRATGWNRFENLFRNPQETFEQPFDYYIMSRTFDKEKCRTGPTPSLRPYSEVFSPDLGGGRISGQYEMK
jgi:hypothetical protein